MGKKVNPLEKVSQRSVGFPFRHHLFFAEYPDFKPDSFCRKAVDDQIAKINTRYLKNDDPRKEESYTPGIQSIEKRNSKPKEEAN